MNFLISLLAGLTQPGAGSEVVTKAANEVATVAENATEAATKASGLSGLFSSGNGMWGMILYIVFFVAIFYFLIIRPQKKRDKQLKEIQAGIQPGDDVMTSSGFYGKVVEVNDDTAVVEFGTNKGVRIPVKKSEIYGTKSNTAETK